MDHNFCCSGTSIDILLVGPALRSINFPMNVIAWWSASRSSAFWSVGSQPNYPRSETHQRACFDGSRYLFLSDVWWCVQSCVSLDADLFKPLAFVDRDGAAPIAGSASPFSRPPELNNHNSITLLVFWAHVATLYCIEHLVIMFWIWIIYDPRWWVGIRALISLAVTPHQTTHLILHQLQICPFPAFWVFFPKDSLFR